MTSDIPSQASRGLQQTAARESTSQNLDLCLVASRSISISDEASRDSHVFGNVTTEGYPGRRFHSGSERVDEIERRAIDAALGLFGAQWANVQPLSASNANLALTTHLLEPGDRVLSMKLSSGGHLTHGSQASFTGRYFDVAAYGLDSAGHIDYDEVRRLAHSHRPALIICGASSFPLSIDFETFRKIADEVGAVLLADVSHPAGLIAAGLYPSPIDHAHFTTLCTHKQLFGAKGGLILSGRSAHEQLPARNTTPAKAMDRAVFPGFQGSPNYASIADKALTLHWAQSATFRTIMERAARLARILAEVLASDLKLVGGGTDSHLVVADVSETGLSGRQAENLLEEAGVLTNRNQVPSDTRIPSESSGVRFGTNIAGFRGIGDDDFRMLSNIIRLVILGRLGSASALEIVRDTMGNYPIPRIAR